MNVKLTKAQKIRIADADDVFKIMKQILLRQNKLRRNKEHFWVICLNGASDLLLVELVALGRTNIVGLEATDIFSLAINKQSRAVIMVHNHPVGSLSPSDSDIDITEKMVAVGKFLGIPVVDHVIITEKAYYSFLDKGILQRIIDEEKYDLNFVKLRGAFAEIESLKKEKLTLAKSLRATAVALLKDGKHSVNEIATLTGLATAAVRNLKKEI